MASLEKKCAVILLIILCSYRRNGMAGSSITKRQHVARAEAVAEMWPAYVSSP